jgi:hypothetical protein
MMEEANRDMRETDLHVRRVAAEERADRKISQLRETFLRRVVQQLDVPEEVADQMWLPALAVLKERHAQWIDADMEELEQLILDAEEWRVTVVDDEPGILPPGPRDPDDDAAPGRQRNATGGAAALGVSALALVRPRTAWGDYCLDPFARVPLWWLVLPPLGEGILDHPHMEFVTE